MGTTTSVKYRAFLSYSHRDRAWGQWLHTELERYRIDKELVGRETSVGPVPKTLRPIFRDREDFSAGHSLSAQTIAVLNQSQFLIVLCSPNAARSQYVNEEIRHFKALGRSDRIIPVIIDGEPGDLSRECFPAALRIKAGLDGAFSGDQEEPIAADARSRGDGKKLATQKVVAGLLGLGLDEIVRRAERARRRRDSWTATLAGLFLLLAVAAIGGLAWARYELARNAALLDRTLERATGILNKTVQLSYDFGISTSVTLILLEEAEGLFQDIVILGSETPQVMSRKAWMLIQFGRNYALLGQSSEQRTRVIEASRILNTLVKQHPTDLNLQRLDAVAQYELGKVEHIQGRFSKALEFFQGSEPRLSALLAASGSSNAQLTLDLAEIQLAIGDTHHFRGNHDEAISAFKRSQASLERLPAGSQSFGMATLQIKIADIYLTRMDLVKALAFYRDSLRILDAHSSEEAEPAQWQNQRAVLHGRIGHIQRIQGNPNEAISSFETELTIFKILQAKDPKNVVWQHNIASTYDGIGETLVDLSRSDDALSAYRSALQIRRTLVSKDPKNLTALAAMMGTEGRIGFLHLIRGSTQEALAAFFSQREIAERLIAMDHAVPDYKIGLALAQDWIASILERDDPAQAVAGYRAAIAVASALATTYPANHVYRISLSTTYLRLGNLLLELENFEDALEAYTRALDLAESSEGGLAESTLASSQTTARVRIKLAEYMQASAAAYNRALRLAQAFDPADRTSAMWLFALATAMEKNGQQFAAHGYPEEAREILGAARQIQDRVTSLLQQR